jgi:hypothetical protein
MYYCKFILWREFIENRIEEDVRAYVDSGTSSMAPKKPCPADTLFV